MERHLLDVRHLGLLYFIAQLFLLFWVVGVGCTLTWTKRMKIALDAAKGLAFLHGAERPIIYRDFKTSNILLDAVCCLIIAILYLHLHNYSSSLRRPLKECKNGKNN